MVEFGLISIPFFGLLFATFQTSFAFLVQQGLQAAVESAARPILVGTVQNNAAITTWQAFRNTYLCPATGSLLPSFIPCANVLVDVRPYTSFSSVTAANVGSSFLSDGPLYNAGSPCQIVVVRAAYPMPVYLPKLVDIGGVISSNTAGLTTYNGKLVQMVTAAAVSRNEPYTVNGVGPGGC